MAERTPRDQETRAKYERPAKWMPPQLLPDPTPEPGYAFRWIRVGFMGKDDARNVSSKLREGWGIRDHVLSLRAHDGYHAHFASLLEFNKVWYGRNSSRYLIAQHVCQHRRTSTVGYRYKIHFVLCR